MSARDAAKEARRLAKQLRLTAGREMDRAFKRTMIEHAERIEYSLDQAGIARNRCGTQIAIEEADSLHAPKIAEACKSARDFLEIWGIEAA